MLDRVSATRVAPSLALRLFRPLAYLWFQATNMHIVGEMPDVPKFVIVAAPHKTNWDLPHIIAAGLHYGIYIQWMGKDSLFKWPFGGLMRWLGGIAIDRSRTNNAVAGMIAAFDAADCMVLAIPPSGTRKDVARWKTGFYHIAVGARVPIALCFIDYTNRTLGVAEVFHPTGNFDADLAKIMAVYAPMIGALPELRKT